jgi:hypothetical protein
MLSKEISKWVRESVEGSCDAVEVPGRANSKIFKIIAKNKKYCLKIYPSKQFDKRERLIVEFEAFAALRKNGAFNVPLAISKNISLNIALYEWIDGVSISKVDSLEVVDALSFVEKLKSISNQKFNISNRVASQACLSANELVSQIDGRFNKLCNIDLEKEAELKNFLKKEFEPIFGGIKEKVSDNWSLPWAYSDELIKSHQLLSPSDFGFHNAIRTNDNKIIYIDFEYFGWDDPVKLTSDFIWHAGMDVSKDAQTQWLSGMSDIFSNDQFFSERLKVYHPLYGLRWCMILLNEFLPKVWKIRKHANKEKEDNYLAIKKIQLEKAKIYLSKVSGLIYADN